MEVIIKCSDDCRDGKNIYGEPIVEIIRCEKCIHWQADKYFCNQFTVGTPEDGYCYMGQTERSDNADHIE